MRRVILRDDDTNALTPIECLERLYRPFLARGMPVNLAVIPAVRTDARTPDGKREGFLLGAGGHEAAPVPLTARPALVEYLRSNPGYQIVQHGCHHDPFEFDRRERAEVVRRLEHGRERLHATGLRLSSAFVAPHDRFSRVAYEETARRFRVISSGWFEWRRLPAPWWSRYLLKKLRRRRHWRVGRTLLLGHPGCLLSYSRSPETMLETIKRVIDREQTVVLVTHWWEYFRDGTPDEPFMRALHETGDYLASRSDVAVTTFDALLERPPRLHAPDDTLLGGVLRRTG